MKFSAQEEYGLRCLVAIAANQDSAGLTIPELSRIEGLTQSHVAKMLSILRKAGFIKSTRGQLGGYTIKVSPERIFVGDVLETLGGRLYEPEFCARHSGIEAECTHKGACNLQPLWTRIQAAVDTVVDQLTIADLLEGKVESESNVRLQFSGSHRPMAPIGSPKEA
jgi:Rrf2 family protein